jgi:hypothetical protein
MSRWASATVVLLALLTSAFFFATRERINRSPAALYFQIAKNLAEGNGFSSKTEAPHDAVRPATGSNA